ncbi:MAG: hypothetical protein IPL00_19195 [Gammaproteobacteria bacterium]|nr:hypothetical protein [Gammaproteobacteria bacterium]
MPGKSPSGWNGGIRPKTSNGAENTDFPDAVAMLFPLAENAPLFMGTPEAPVNLWYWRADHPSRARSDIATGSAPPG